LHERRSLRPAAALGLAMFLPAFGTHGLTAGRAALAESIGIEAGEWRMALLMAGFALASVAAYAVAGRLGDAGGLRRWLVAGVAAYLAAHALILISVPLSSLLSSPPWLLFLGLRLLAGLAGGAITVCANALGAALYPPSERGRSLSLVWLGVPLALVVGVPLPGYLNGAWAALPAGIRPWLGEPYAAVATLVALAVLLFVPVAVPAAVATGGARAAAAGARIANGPAAALPSLRATWWVYAVALLLPFGVFPLIVSAEPYAERAFGFGPVERGHLFVLLGAASVAGGLFSGVAADRLGRRRTLLFAAGLFALLVPALPGCGAPLYVALAGLLGFVSTVRQGPFQALASFLADARGRGRLSARVLISSQVGISLGQLAGILLVRETGGGASIGTVAACSTAATALAWGLSLRFREPGTERA
jgi:MFS family permease